MRAGDALALEARRLLSGGAIHALRVQALASRRVPPAAKINSEYASFLADFRKVEQAYIASLNDQATGTTTVSANLIQPYVSGGSPAVTIAQTVKVRPRKASAAGMARPMRASSSSSRLVPGGGSASKKAGRA